MNPKIPYANLSQRDKRSLIFHLLYAIDANDYQLSCEAIVAKFNLAFDAEIPEDCPEIATVTEIIQQKNVLDSEYQFLLANWRPERLGLATKLILRYGIWEMLNTTTSLEIIINEAIELAKCFAEQDAYKFINGVLDEIAKKNSIAPRPKESSDKRNA